MRHSNADVVQELERAIRDAGSLRALARQWGVSAALLSQTRLGQIPVGPALASKLGFTDDGKKWVRTGAK